MAKSIFDIDKFDLMNLIMVKGANFILIATIFLLVSKYIESSEFIDFGFYWGISIMTGGIVYGGLAATLVRLISLDGGLRTILEHPAIRWIVLITALLILATLILVFNGFGYDLLMPFILFSLGASIQGQIAIISLLRALNASKHVVVSSTGMLLLIPCVFIILHNSNDGLTLIFGKLVAAYSIGLIFTGVVATCKVRGLDSGSRDYDVIPLKGLKESYFSFTLLNIYAYVFVMIDFHLLREILSADALSQAGFAKIYFDRFVIPILSLITGVVSLNVLRTKTKSMVGNHSFTIKYDFSKKKAFWLVFPILLVIVVGYYFYSMLWDSDLPSLGYIQVLGLLLGYIFFTLNNVYFDILAIKFGNLLMLSIVIVNLSLTYAIYYLLISAFGLDGWVAAVFMINCSFSLVFYKITKTL